MPQYAAYISFKMIGEVMKIDEGRGKGKEKAKWNHLQKALLLNPYVGLFSTSKLIIVELKFKMCHQ